MEAGRGVVILGAGPAGLSAALWLRNLGLEPLVLDTAERAGGLQNLNFLANDWVLGQPGETGPTLAARLVAHAVAAGVTVRTSCRLLGLDGTNGAFRLRVEDSAEAREDVAAAAVLIATGTRYRAAEVLAGAEGLAAVPVGRFAFGPYAFADLAGCAGRRILIVGGGDNAFENARLLAPRAAGLWLAMRSPARAQHALAGAVAAEAARGRCRLLQPARIVALAERDEGVEVTLHVGGVLEAVTVDRIHVLAGYEPNTGFIAGCFAPELAAALAFDARGYLVVDGAARTGAPGVYGAGDVCNPAFPSVVSALAQGALAAKTIELDLRP